MLVAFQISCVLVILILYKVSPALLVEWYSRIIRCFLTNTPFADKDKLFPDASILENNYKKIRAEINSVLESGEFPILHSINEDDNRDARENEPGKQQLRLRGFDEWIYANDSPLPYIDALLCELPQVTNVVIRVCRSGEHIAQRVRLFKGVLCYHLPLLSQANGQNFIVCGNIRRNYKEGAGILTDETFRHELWNRSDAPQVFLSLDISRDNALPRLIRPFNRILIRLIAQSRRMREAVRLAEVKLARRSSKIHHQLKIKES